MIKHPQKQATFYAFILVLMLNFQGFSQKINAGYERFSVSTNKYIHSGMAMSPDQSKMAISCIQGFPLYIYDYEKREIIKQFDVGNWYAGSRVSWSAKGKYLLLQQLFYHDFAKNKDREVNFEIIDANSGRDRKSVV